MYSNRTTGPSNLLIKLASSSQVIFINLVFNNCYKILKYKYDQVFELYISYKFTKYQQNQILAHDVNIIKYCSELVL